MRSARLVLLLSAILLSGPVRLRADEEAGVKGGVDDVQAEINRAIERGVHWVLGQQLVDGSWGHEASRYPGGMTGLALYTLLKSGVPLDHPCVSLGFANLLSLDPHETYVVACHLLALGATGDPAHHPRLEALAERLLSWQVRGSWSYPLGHEGEGWSERGGLLDLSNTQFAILGLKAAHEAGVSVPRKVLRDVVRQTRFHQHLPEMRAGEGEAAGFAYRPPDQHGLGPATGSMTCAGITVLDVCRRLLGRNLPAREARRIEEGIDLGLRWLDANWTVRENPGREQAHKLYYLYGLERVGSLLGVERIGSHAWYAEGARELLSLRKEGGEWGNQSDTCFALLFLLRATKGQATGGGRARAALPAYATDPDSALRLRAEGHSPLAVWVASFAPSLPGRPREVQYLVDDEVVLTAVAGPWPHGADPTYRVVLNFPRAGKYVVRARARLAGPDGERVVDSAPLAVDVRFVVPPWAPYEAAWAGRNLVVREQASASASTRQSDHLVPARTVDARTPGYWTCRAKPADPRPTLAVDLGRPVKANAVVLHPVLRRDEHRTRFDRPTRIEVTLDGRGDPRPVPLPSDEMRPSVLRLPKARRVSSLEIVVSERTPGRTWPGECGFREVTLEMEAVRPPSFDQAADGVVTLACETEGAEIRYTLDGSIPTRRSPRYAGPFAWPHESRLHAIAVLSTGEGSRLTIARTHAPE